MRSSAKLYKGGLPYTGRLACEMRPTWYKRIVSDRKAHQENPLLCTSVQKNCLPSTPVLTYTPVSSVEHHPKRRASLNIFKTSLEALGETPLPFIKLTITLVLAVIQRLEEVPEVSAAWEDLSQRMERLSAFVITLSESLGSFPERSIDNIERHGRTMNEELERLSQAIENAQKDRSHKFISFWNTTEDVSCAASFAKRLDTLVADLTLAICGTIGFSIATLEQILDAFIKDLRKNTSGSEIHVRNNVVGHVDESTQVFAENKILGQGKMYFVGNTITDVKQGAKIGSGCYIGHHG